MINLEVKKCGMKRCPVCHDEIAPGKETCGHILCESRLKKQKTPPQKRNSVSRSPVKKKTTLKPPLKFSSIAQFLNYIQMAS